jgi:hypothetical protein
MERIFAALKHSRVLAKDITRKMDVFKRSERTTYDGRQGQAAAPTFPPLPFGVREPGKILCFPIMFVDYVIGV